MSDFEPKDFETVLDTVEHKIDDLVQCDIVRSIGGNLNTRDMPYRAKNNHHHVGTIIVGEDDGAIAVDITTLDDAVTSFRLEDENDRNGIQNITDWFQQHYRQ